MHTHFHKLFSSESLFAGDISSKFASTGPPTPSSSSQPPPDTYKFSTFGYHNAPPSADASSTLQYPMYSTRHPTHLPCRDSRCDSVTHTIDITPTSTVIDNYEYINRNCETVLPPQQHQPTPPPPPSSSIANMRNFNSAPRKMEESCIMLEIRNSAPDVIIMTSHWHSIYALVYTLRTF